MAEPNGNDLALAADFAEMLASRSGRHTTEYPIPLDDVRQSFEDLDVDVEFVGEVGLPGVPAIAGMYDKLPVTVAIQEIYPRFAWFGEYPRWRTAFFGRFERLGARFLDPGVARDAMRQLARVFIANRIAGIRELEDRATPTLRLSGQTTPGCAFDVHTASKGLRVHWSGAYRISGNYFGHPTSPASSVLQSGVYVFGVDGGAYTSTQWDTATKVTLPGPHTSITLNY
jgi:hypothetical protein